MLVVQFARDSNGSRGGTVQGAVSAQMQESLRSSDADGVELCVYTSNLQRSCFGSHVSHRTMHVQHRRKCEEAFAEDGVRRGFQCTPGQQRFEF